MEIYFNYYLVFVNLIQPLTPSPCRIINTMNLLVLGCGNMGSAMVTALSRRSVPLFKKILAFDANPEKAQALEAFGATALTSLDALPKGESWTVLVAVKPQDIDALLKDLRGRFAEHFGKGSFLISIAAGVRMERLQKSGLNSIVRVMPNTPAMVGLGASGWIASAAATPEQKQLTVQLLESFGIAIEVQDEDKLDAVTALSGSGPAYVFYFLEALTQAGVNVGLSEKVAQSLATQTVLGGVTLAKQRAQTLEDLKKLRAQVTSKGGTTAAGIAIFENENLKSSIEQGVEAAYRRAKEL